MFCCNIEEYLYILQANKEFGSEIMKNFGFLVKTMSSPYSQVIWQLFKFSAFEYNTSFKAVIYEQVRYKTVTFACIRLKDRKTVIFQIVNLNFWIFLYRVERKRFTLQPPILDLELFWNNFISRSYGPIYSLNLKDLL